MSNDSQKELLTEAQKTELVFILSQLAVAVMTGKKIEHITVQVPLTIPKAIYDLIETVAKEAEVEETKDMIGKLASEGLNKMLQEGTVAKQASPPPKQEPKEPSADFNDLAKQMGIDMSQFQGHFNKLGDFAKQLEDLSTTLGVSHATGNNPPNKHNK